MPSLLLGRLLPPELKFGVLPDKTTAASMAAISRTLKTSFDFILPLLSRSELCNVGYASSLFPGEVHGLDGFSSQCCSHLGLNSVSSGRNSLQLLSGTLRTLSLFHSRTCAVEGNVELVDT